MSVLRQPTDPQILRPMFVSLESALEPGPLKHRFTADELLQLHINMQCQITQAHNQIVACVALRPATSPGYFELACFWAIKELEKQKWPRTLFRRTVKVCKEAEHVFLVADSEEGISLANHLKMEEVKNWQDVPAWRNAYRNGRFPRDSHLRLFKTPRPAL